MPASPPMPAASATPLTDSLCGAVRGVLLDHPAEPQICQLCHHPTITCAVTADQHVARVLALHASHKENAADDSTTACASAQRQDICLLTTERWVGNNQQPNQRVTPSHTHAAAAWEPHTLGLLASGTQPSSTRPSTTYQVSMADVV